MMKKYSVVILSLLAFFIPREFSFYFFPMAFLYLVFLDKSLFRFIPRLSFIFLAIIILVLQPLLSSDKDISFYGIYYSSVALYNGIFMIFRAIIIIPSITYLSRMSDKAKLQKFFERIGIENFNELLVKAQSILPSLSEHTKHFISSAAKNRYYNPIEFTARFIAFIIKTTHLNNYRPEEKEIQ